MPRVWLFAVGLQIWCGSTLCPQWGSRPQGSWAAVRGHLTLGDGAAGACILYSEVLSAVPISCSSWEQTGGPQDSGLPLLLCMFPGRVLAASSAPGGPHGC